MVFGGWYSFRDTHLFLFLIWIPRGNQSANDTKLFNVWALPVSNHLTTSGSAYLCACANRWRARATGTVSSLPHFHTSCGLLIIVKGLEPTEDNKRCFVGIGIRKIMVPWGYEGDKRTIIVISWSICWPQCLIIVTLPNTMKGNGLGSGAVLWHI